jgi:hypothetical protein
MLSLNGQELSLIRHFFPPSITIMKTWTVHEILSEALSFLHLRNIQSNLEIDNEALLCE